MVEAILEETNEEYWERTFGREDEDYQPLTEPEEEYPRPCERSWNYTGEFLKQFPLSFRGAVGDNFCRRIREGFKTPETVVHAVHQIHKLNVQMYGKTSELGKLLLAPGVLDSAEALEYAEFLIERESLPFEERHRLKEECEAENKEGFIKLAMSQQPPTPKQLAYLKALDCPLIPKSKLEASELIEEYKAKK